MRPPSLSLALHTILDVVGNSRSQHHGEVCGVGALGIQAGGIMLSIPWRVDAERRGILAAGWAAAAFLFGLIDGADADRRRSYGEWKVSRQRLSVSTR